MKITNAAIVRARKALEDGDTPLMKSQGATKADWDKIFEPIEAL